VFIGAPSVAKQVLEQGGLFRIAGFGCMRDIDFFNFWRILLAWIVTVYATVIMLQSLWGWYLWLAGSDKYVSMLRQYVIVHGLRLRFKTFWGDVLICVLLCVAFAFIWQAHYAIYRLGAEISDVRRLAQPG
jgi:hypothetical protein